ncbi:putative argininosuccinate lyase [Rosellinia necatrix]|uniref:Putative argininosuccinate lyase n=1 Tax=Rosellinia necatrix TaxID=77044 RepID=A0A1S8A600_ROSNE|nr:putative argininosuccinate lyase [Rosellinia necatrix]
MAAELGFLGGLLCNLIGAVADRDLVAKTLQRGSMLMMHVSRWAEDLIVYSTGEFGSMRRLLDGELRWVAQKSNLLARRYRQTCLLH